MSKHRHISHVAIIRILIICLLFSGVAILSAQASHQQDVLTRPTADGIQFIVQALDVDRTQMVVFNLSGRPVYESGWTWGRRLMWRPMSQSGAPLANGVYLYLLSVERHDGQTMRQVGMAVVLRGEVQKTVQLMSATAEPDQRRGRQASPSFKIDHFQCYVVAQGQPANLPVQLQDQFDIKNQVFPQYRVTSPARFCNPTNKVRVRPTPSENTPIKNPAAHLTFYQIVLATDDAQTQPRSVVVTNQFGANQELRVADTAESVAVPTKKEQEPDPTGLDHFKCYKASGKSAEARVHLRDQFWNSTNLSVFEPILFCNPTRKIHGNNTFGVQNATDHLVCYLITRRDFPRDVRIKNQFLEQTLSIRQSDTLCVPSLKIKFSDAPVTPGTPGTR